MKRKPQILFLCTGNSCRSQMAEGWARQLKGDEIEPYSAGVETHGLNPQAVKVMAEAGVDISGHRSKNVAELTNVPFDYVVTVCDNAAKSCPIFPKNRGQTPISKQPKSASVPVFPKVIHVGFDDPPALAKGAKTEEEALAPYRRVRDEIKAFVMTLPDALKARKD